MPSCEASERSGERVKMKRTIQKNTLGFMTSAIYKYIRTPVDIWQKLNDEFHFTLDACASDTNHLLLRYYTEENSCLDKDWTGEIVYCHPLFNGKIGKFVEKCAIEKCLSVMLLPSATHTRYFHRFIWDKDNARPRPNVEIRFLEKPTRGFNFGNDNGEVADIPKGKVGYIKPLMIVIFRG